MGTTLISERYIEVNGAALRVRSAGAGPAVVLVHGWALDLDMWQPQLELLADHYHVVAFDRRGFGLSSGAPSIEQDVRDVDRLLNHLNVTRATIVGMSQGARVAMRWALKDPERVSCLILDGPPAEAWSPSLDAPEIPIDEYRYRVRYEGIDAFRRAWLPHPFMQLHTSAPRTHELLRDMVTRYPALDLLNDDLPAVRPISLRDLRRLDVPALIVSGQHDSAQRRTIASKLADGLPDAQVQILRGAGHLAALDDAETYAKVLHKFLSTRRRWSTAQAV